MPLLRLLPLLLAALLFLGEAPLHARHALEMGVAQPGPAPVGEACGGSGMEMAGHEHHPSTPPTEPATHPQDHTCCLPSIGALAPVLRLPVVTAWLPHPLAPTSVQAHRLAVLHRARGPPSLKPV